MQQDTLSCDSMQQQVVAHINVRFRSRSWSLNLRFKHINH